MKGVSLATSARRPLARLNDATNTIMGHGRMGRNRLLVLLVATFAAFALVGGCGSKPGLAIQQQAPTARARQGNTTTFRAQVAADMKKRAAAHLARQRQTAAERITRQRQAEAISAAIQTKTADVAQVLQYFGISPDDLCGPIGPNGAGKAQGQARQLLERRRKQALYYLNLPALRSSPERPSTPRLYDPERAVVGSVQGDADVDHCDHSYAVYGHSPLGASRHRVSSHWSFRDRDSVCVGDGHRIWNDRDLDRVASAREGAPRVEVIRHPVGWVREIHRNDPRS